MENSVAIMEKFLPKEILINVAKTVRKAQDIHEGSWININSISGGYYSLDHLESAKKAVEFTKIDAFWVNIIFTWNAFYWNDIQWWADAILNRKEK